MAYNEIPDYIERQYLTEPYKPEARYKCDWCGEDIYEGDVCYDFGANGSMVCQNCVEDAEKTA